MVVEGRNGNFYLRAGIIYLLQILEKHYSSRTVRVCQMITCLFWMVVNESLNHF